MTAPLDDLASHHDPTPVVGTESLIKQSTRRAAVRAHIVEQNRYTKRLQSMVQTITAAQSTCFRSSNVTVFEDADVILNGITHLAALIHGYRHFPVARQAISRAQISNTYRRRASPQIGASSYEQHRECHASS